MSSDIHETSLKLAHEWLENISDEQFLKEHNAIEKKQKLLMKSDFKETSFFRKMKGDYLALNNDFSPMILSDLKSFLSHLKKISPSTRTHYQELDEYINYKYEFIHNLLDKHGFVNGKPNINKNNKPATFFFEIYSRLESFTGSALFVSSDGVTPSKSSARDRNNWLIKEMEQLIRFIEIDRMPDAVMSCRNLSKYFFEVDKELSRNTIVANTNGSTIITASASTDSNMLIEISFLRKPLQLSIEEGVFIKSLNDSVFESESFLMEADLSSDIDFIINSIAKEKYSLYDMFGYNQVFFFKFSDSEKIQLNLKNIIDFSDDMAP